MIETSTGGRSVELLAQVTANRTFTVPESQSYVGRRTFTAAAERLGVWLRITFR